MVVDPGGAEPIQVADLDPVAVLVGDRVRGVDAQLVLAEGLLERVVAEDPADERVAEAGVLGVLPGIIGSIQAMEAIKLILGIGDTLTGRLLAYDALEESFRTFKVNRDPDCPACGPNAGEIVIAEYDELCMPHPKVAPVS